MRVSEGYGEDRRNGCWLSGLPRLLDLALAATAQLLQQCEHPSLWTYHRRPLLASQHPVPVLRALTASIC